MCNGIIESTLSSSPKPKKDYSERAAFMLHLDLTYMFLIGSSKSVMFHYICSD